jgi:ribosome maturation factor RimP
MTTNEKIVKQGFELHGFSFRTTGGKLVLNHDLSTIITIQQLTEVCRTISRVVGFGLPGNDDDHA